MNNQLANLTSCVFYDRQTEFKVILEQLKGEFLTLKIGKDKKNLIGFLAENNKLSLVLILLAHFEKFHKELTEQTKKEIFKTWMNEEDKEGLSPIFIAIFYSDIVQ